MLKHIFMASLCLLMVSVAARAEGSLTAQETRWLAAAGPVLAYAQRLNLPIDITVQPQPGPHDVPLAMGFDGQRCKLVLSIRGNPDAESLFAQAPQIERTLLIEVMTAHEIAHCWRYASGVWHALPAGFNDAGVDDANKRISPAEAKAMRETRREEGYADLVALAWIARNHPGKYAQVYGWLESVRREPRAARGAHDTRAWVRLARDAAAFGHGATPFDDVAALWRQGLQGE
ncbi:MAG: hypothetical protein H7335_03130 [Massilia sp.]|nr:hypothetical protein [Massilia sp.]